MADEPETGAVEPQTPAEEPAAPSGEAPAEPGEPQAPADVTPTGEEPPKTVDEPPTVGDETKKRIQALTRKFRDAERRAIAAEAEARTLREVHKPAPEEPAPTGPPKPREEDFENYAEYTEALTDWKVDQREAKWKAEQEAAKGPPAPSERDIRFNEAISTASEKYEDFEDVAFAPTVPITERMVEIMKDCEHPVDVAYYLGKHLQECVAISHMTPTAAAIAIGKIDVAMKEKPPSPTPKKVSGAPAPIKPVGSGEIVMKDPTKMSMAEYKKWRRGEA